MKEPALPKTQILQALSILAVVLIAGLGYGGYQYWLLNGRFMELEARLNEATTTLAAKMAENADLASTLAVEQHKNGDFENQLNGLSTAVTKINKLQATDPQLLAKYSKVYFLNDNYVPKELTALASSSTYADKKSYALIPTAARRIEQMIDDAKDDGINLLVISSYRSFKEQASLKVSYKLTYGSGANAFSADQGYSEHQLGTAVDFTTKELGAAFNTFDKASAYAWLNKNAYKYGFVLSYPSGNGYYVFEPWHWRYVGLKLAGDLHDQDKYFYQLDQRAINEYLIDFANEE
jgi:D-alanyl-D-alanine carboxypeptidase